VTEQQFRAIRGPAWKAFAEVLGRRPRQRFPDRQALDFPSDYRRLCRDLNQARALRFSPQLIEDLNRLVTQGHQILYQRSRGAPSWLDTLTERFPAAVRRSWQLFVLAHVLFYGALVAAGFYVQEADRAEALLGQATVEQYLDMYNPESALFLKPRGVTGDADMFGFYIQHNISIGLTTFASGVLAGLGSLFFVAFNGVALGAAAGVVLQAGYQATFLPFVVGHGSLELTAILIAGVAGFRLGLAVIRPGTCSRVESVRREGLETLPLVAGCIAFLFLAACLEAFWSAQPGDPVWKYSVAGVLWPLVYGFLLGGGRRGRP